MSNEENKSTIDKLIAAIWGLSPELRSEFLRRMERERIKRIPSAIKKRNKIIRDGLAKFSTSQIAKGLNVEGLHAEMGKIRLEMINGTYDPPTPTKSK